MRSLFLALVTTAALVAQLPATVAADPPTAPQKVAALFLAAREGSDRSAGLAAQAVVACGRPAASELLLAGVAARTPSELVWIVRCLRELGEVRLREVLPGLLAHGDPTVRAESLLAGLCLFPEEMGLRVLEAVSDTAPMVRRRAYEGLSKVTLPAEKSLELALRGVQDDDFWINHVSFRALKASLVAGPGAARVSQKQLFRDALPVLRKIDLGVSMRLLTTLARIDKAAMPKLLRSVLDDGSPGARTACYRVAVNLGLDLFRVQARHEIGGTRDARLRSSAITYVVAVKDLETVPVLVGLLEAPLADDEREEIAVALREITGKAFGYDVAKWQAYVRAQRL